MQVIEFPERERWTQLLQRPTLDTTFLERTVANILKDVRENGDAGLRHCARFFDKVELDDFLVTEAEFDEADSLVADELKAAIKTAKANIEKFHLVPQSEPKVIETTSGVFCWRRSVAIEKVGLYVPAGSSPLFSTVLMLAIPAKLAGCREVVMCSPPNSKGKIDATSLYTARLCGVTKMFKVGGAQA